MAKEALRARRERPLAVNILGVHLLPKSARRPGLIRKACRLALQSGKRKPSGEINVLFASRAKMLSFNKRFLGHDYDTDVISFGSGARNPREPSGDIIVSVHQARKQARGMGHSLLREILVLCLHGTLHLMGYDDGTESKKAAMFRKQDELLRHVLR